MSASSGSHLTTGRVVAVLAATLLGCALTALLLGGRLWGGPGPTETASDGSSAGLRIPAPTTSSTATPTAVAPSASPSVSPSASPSASPSGKPVAVPSAAAAAPSVAVVAEPTRVSVPRLGVDMSVEAQGVDGNGQMGLPADPAVAGWYKFGAAPTDPTGAVVVAAHVDSRTRGVGPFSRLGSARPGDEVDLWVGATRLTYRVSQVATVDKAQLDADGLFSLVGDPRLHLVTCTGDYAPGSGYTQNLVVVADRVTT